MDRSISKLVVSTNGRVYNCTLKVRSEGRSQAKCSWDEKCLVAGSHPSPEKACLCAAPEGVFLIGGRADRTNSLRLNRYIQTTSEATIKDPQTKQPLHVARDIRSAAICCDSEFILVAGGDADGTCEVFSTCIGQWMRMLNPLPAPRFCHNLVSLGGPNNQTKGIYSLGGFDVNNKPLRSVLKLKIRDLALKTPDQKASAVLKAEWCEVSPMRQARHSFASVVYRGRIIVIGGDNGNTLMNDVEIYNPEKNQWRIADHRLVRARKCHSSLIFSSGDQRDYLVIINGVDSGMRPVREIEVIPLDQLFDEKSPDTFRVIGLRQGKLGIEEYLASASIDSDGLGAMSPPSTPPKLSREQSLYQGSDSVRERDQRRGSPNNDSGNSFIDKFKSKMWNYRKGSSKYPSFSSRDTTVTSTYSSEHEQAKKTVITMIGTPYGPEDTEALVEVEHDNKTAEGDPFNWFLL